MIYFSSSFSKTLNYKNELRPMTKEPGKVDPKKENGIHKAIACQRDIILMAGKTTSFNLSQCVPFQPQLKMHPLPDVKTTEEEG